jgi:uncharacterized membrane protein
MWAIYGMIAGIIAGISRILRKYIYNNNKISMKQGFFLVIIGFLIGIIIDTSMNMKNYNIDLLLDSKKNKPQFLMILSGILIFIVFKCYNISLYNCENPGWVSAIYAGVGIIATYILSIIFLNNKINIIKMLGILFTIIGITIILVF